MKLKFKVDGKVVEKEVPNKLHEEVRNRTRASVHRSKKTYSRKQKHKNRRIQEW